MNEKQLYSLYEAISNIAYIAGKNKYYSGDSRKDIADFIEWAIEFETINSGVEWGVSKDYIEEINSFATYKIGMP